MPSSRLRCELVGFGIKASRKKGAARKPCCKETSLPQKKKEQGGKPCSKNCVDPISPKNWI
jgi:hypothetical protein